MFFFNLHEKKINEAEELQETLNFSIEMFIEI